MTTSTWRRTRLVVAATVAVMAAALPASADRERVRDRRGASGRPMDMKSVVHAHGPSERILRHEIHFDGSPDPSEEVSGSVFLFFKFRNPKGRGVRRELRVYENPGGGLYGAFYTRDYELTGYSRAWMEDDSTLVVEFSVPALGRLENDRYRWYAWTTLGAGEFENPCEAEDQGPPVCKDRAPASGSILHRL